MWLDDEDLLDIGLEGAAVDRPVEHEGRDHAAQGESGDEGRGLDADRERGRLMSGRDGGFHPGRPVVLPAAREFPCPDAAMLRQRPPRPAHHSPQNRAVSLNPTSCTGGVSSLALSRRRPSKEIDPDDANLFHGCLLLQEGVRMHHHLGTSRCRREEASTPSFLHRRAGT